MKCLRCNQSVEPVLWDALSYKNDHWIVVWICKIHGLLLARDVVGNYLQMELFAEEDSK